jgi:hypothetical protein
MKVVEETGLWQRSLGASVDSENGERFRTRLVAALTALRDRAALLGGEIARDHPDFPVHDVSHSDALWGLADRIAGPEAALTPTEAFVFGASVLVHDLGMASAAYVDGADSIQQDPRWPDRVAWVLRNVNGRSPRADEVADPSPEVALAATAALLRELHAERAERLISASWSDSKGRTYQLLEDELLREAFGPTIGLIAHSHWWAVSTVGERFTHNLGAPGDCPAEWTTNPLPLACLLRLADASHLSGSRAPRFLRALRNPGGESEEHWEFQAHLSQPFVEKDRFVFTGTPFGAGEPEAWWRCADTLRAVDDEFRAVDSLLADRDEMRFQVRGVAGTESPERLAERVPTDGWSPVDASLQVTDVVRLVDRFGGRALYGDRVDVPLRELLQNGSDAVRAQRALDDLAADWGAITVRLQPLEDGEEQGDRWLELEDTGVGMSSGTLSGHLLDFGRSYWESEQVLLELPGLLAKGFAPTGRYGVGFFSVFMWDGDVRITSWRHGESKADTRVLEFKGGLTKRPLLRPARAEERLARPGTRVAVRLGREVLDRLGLGEDVDPAPPLTHLCAWLAPALEVDVVVEGEGEDPAKAISAGDWRTLRMDRLAERLAKPPDADVDPGSDRDGPRKTDYDDNLRDLTLSDGALVGRALLDPGGTVPGAIVVGGLRAAGVKNIGGVLLGEPVSATRQAARPLVPPEVLAAWASEQATLLAPRVEGGEAVVAAELVFFCGGDPGPLPIALTPEGLLSKDEAADWIVERDEVIAAMGAGDLIGRVERGEIELPNGCAAAMAGSGALLEQAPSAHGEDELSSWPASMFESEISGLGAFVDLVECLWEASFRELMVELVAVSEPDPSTHRGAPLGFRLRRPE